jgi:hypothetical protein
LRAVFNAAAAASLGTNAVGVLMRPAERQYGFVPTRPGRARGVGTTPALQGFFRAGSRTVGISQINAMATNLYRGG